MLGRPSFDMPMRARATSIFIGNKPLPLPAKPQVSSGDLRDEHLRSAMLLTHICRDHQVRGVSRGQPWAAPAIDTGTPWGHVTACVSITFGDQLQKGT